MLRILDLGFLIFGLRAAASKSKIKN